MNKPPKASFIQVLEIINSHLKQFFQDYYRLRIKKKGTSSSHLGKQITKYLQDNFEKHTEAYQDAINTCLLLACKYDVIGVVLQMIKFGANINYQNYNAYSPIHLACFSGNHRVLKVLIDNGANPFLIDNEGFTPKELIPYRKKMLVEKHGSKANLSGFKVCEKIIQESEKDYFEMLKKHHQEDSLAESIMKNKDQVMQFRSAINKLSATNVVCIIKLISQIEPQSEKQFEEMVEIFYQRCLLDQKFTALYAVLVKVISQVWRPLLIQNERGGKGKKKYTFQNKLSTYLQKTGLHMENIKLVGYLSVLRQIPWSLILDKLMTNYQKLDKIKNKSSAVNEIELYMEESTQLIRYVGRNMSRKNSDLLDNMMQLFSKFMGGNKGTKDKPKIKISKRVQFMVTELQELRTAKWKFPDGELFDLDKKMRKTDWDEIIAKKTDPPKTLATRKSTFSKYYNSRVFQAEREYLLEQSICQYTYSTLISNGYWVSHYHQSLSEDSKDEIKDMMADLNSGSSPEFMITEMLQYQIDDHKLTLTQIIKYLFQVWEELDLSSKSMLSILKELTPSFPQKIYLELLKYSPPPVSKTHLLKLNTLFQDKINNMIVIPQICQEGIKCHDSNKDHQKKFIHYR